jgi:NADH:ubiquinone oxidoreductase subunit 6 (subunit J)
MFSKYMLPFEIAGVLLLMALIGASVIASTIKSKKE